MRGQMAARRQQPGRSKQSIPNRDPDGGVAVQPPASQPEALTAAEEADRVLDSALSLRPGRRQRPLAQLQSYILLQYDPDFLSANVLTLLSVCLGSAEKGATGEANAAISLIVPLLLHAENLPAGEIEATETTLRKLATSSRNGFVKELAGVALAACVMVGEQDEQAAYEWLFQTASSAYSAPAFLEPDAGLFNGAPASSEMEKGLPFRLHLAQTHGLLQALVLLATGWDWSMLATWKEPPVDVLLPLCREALRRRSSPGLRLTGALGIALLVEAKLRCSDVDDEDSSDEGPVKKGKKKNFDPTSTDETGSNASHGETRLAAECAQLAQELRTRDDWREQRAQFRAMLALQQGNLPEDTIMIGSRTLRIYSFAVLIRYEWLRQSLRGTLDLALQQPSSTARRLLLCEDRRNHQNLCSLSDSYLTTEDKRLRTADARSRERDRTKDRKQKTTMLHNFPA